MSSIGIVVDEGADLLPQIIKKHQIGIVPVKLDWPEIEDLPGDNIYQKMREAENRGMKTFGKTSQPSPKDFLDVYKNQLEIFEKIICITITSKLSGTYNSAIQAKNFLPSDQKDKIFVVDSLNVSGGEALMVFKALEIIQEGGEVEQIAEELRKWPPKIYLRAIIEDPKWAETAGRLSSTAANWSRRLQKMGVHPLLGFKKGRLKPVSLKIGEKDRVSVLLKYFKNKTESIRNQNKKVWVVITHGDNFEGSQELKEKIEESIPETCIIYTNLINNIIGSLAGPGTLALSWTESQKDPL